MGDINDLLDGWSPRDPLSYVQPADSSITPRSQNSIPVVTR